MENATIVLMVPIPYDRAVALDQVCRNAGISVQECFLKAAEKIVTDLGKAAPVAPTAPPVPDSFRPNPA